MKLFLDIDGVMVHANPSKKVEFEDDGFYKFNDLAVSIINSVIPSDTEIVLSTSHRHRFSIKTWKNIFIKRGLMYNNISIIEKDLSYTRNRRMEIMEWVCEKEWLPEEIVIIDDDKSLNGLPKNFRNRLVLTNPYIGLSDVSEVKMLFSNYYLSLNKKI